jgi:hypothetical protein
MVGSDGAQSVTAGECALELAEVERAREVRELERDYVGTRGVTAA